MVVWNSGILVLPAKKHELGDQNKKHKTHSKKCILHHGPARAYVYENRTKNITWKQNIPKLKATQLSISKRMDEYVVV